MLRTIYRRLRRPTSARLARRKQQRELRLESLEDRQMFALMTSVEPGGILAVTGSEVRDDIRVINHGYSTTVYDSNLPVFSMQSDSLTRIRIDARGGNDTVTVINVPFYHSDPLIMARFNRPLPATIDGGAGNDVLNGSQANDVLRDNQGNNTFNAGAGNDTVYGGGGNDVINGGAGDDYLYGYDGKNTIRGGPGADHLYGGGQADTLEGEAGNDRLYGYSGDDTLRGGDGDDRLFGDGGHDLLYGGAGNDHLYGYAGNDRLYGDSGHDMLDGGLDQDGLFGGGGVDTLSGGGGADRFLVWDAFFSDIAFHTVRDREAADAVIRFKDTWGTQQANGMTWAGDVWAEDEIESVDDSLHWLHRLVNNTSLLKDSQRADLVFERWGANLESAGQSIFAWNLGGGRMSITDQGFANGKAELDLTVVHEMAHNWDSENPRWSEWLALSGWQQASNGSWSAWPGAIFYRGGAANPFEDFAWSFEAYYLRSKGLLGSDAGLTAKLSFIDRFVQSMRT